MHGKQPKNNRLRTNIFERLWNCNILDQEDKYPQSHPIIVMFQWIHIHLYYKRLEDEDLVSEPAVFRQ